MEPENIAKQLESLIVAGKLRQVQDILEYVHTDVEINDITKKFSDRDPVILAVDKEKENIALFLIEKGFTFSTLYTYPGAHCNQWCHKHHQTVKCPTEYNALDLAKERGLKKVVHLIQDIQNGLRQPGEGLTQIHVLPDDCQRESPRRSPVKLSGKIEKAVPSPELTPSYTAATLAKQKLERRGITYITKDGDTLLHETVSHHDNPAMVHVCANARININAQNFNGDTALHIAVRKNHLESAKALLMNGSDVTHRNKLGQTPLDQSEGAACCLLKSYRCGLLAALSRGEQSAMQRIMRLWPNPDAVIMHGVTALELAAKNCQKGKSYQACYNLLKGSLHTLRLVHAVLSEDLEHVKELLKEDTGYNINVRYKDHHGETPLSCAIDQHSLELVQLLMETGRCHTNIRVRETHWNESTIPLHFKTLELKCPIDIWRYMANNAEPPCHSDRDCHGNTSILRAIVNGKPAEFIKVLLMSSGGQDIPYRNTENLHARDLAKLLSKQEIVETIDQYICDTPSYLLMKLPVSFYGEDNMQIYDKDGQTLLDRAIGKGTEHDIIAIKQYKLIEQQGRQLFKAACSGDVISSAKLNTASFQDRNGYTALIYAIVFNQPKVAENLITQRPALCALPDNYGRVPLHYAYALPEAIGSVFIKMLLRREGDKMEHCTDKDGREPAEYQNLRATIEITQLMEHVMAQLGNAKGKESPLEDGA